VVQAAVSPIPRDPFVVSLIDAINLRHGTSYHVLTPTDAGESHSAYLLDDRNGKRCILKFGYGVEFNPKFAARVTTQLRVLGYPAPAYAEIGEHNRWTYAVQEQLPGVPGRQEIFTHSILDEAIELNRMHQLREPPNDDWHAELCRSVLVGYENYCRVDSLRTHSAETLRVLDAAQQAAAAPRDNSSPTRYSALGLQPGKRPDRGGAHYRRDRLGGRTGRRRMLRSRHSTLLRLSRRSGAHAPAPRTL
jgi:hypothetical protein